MKNIRAIACAWAVAVTVGVAGAPAEAAAGAGSTGASIEQAAGRWEKLGTRTVDGRLDRDVITVGRAKGRYSALRMRVEGSSLVLHELRVVFTNGEVYEPKTRFHFEKSSSTRVIDLPGDTRTIRQIELKYGNVSSKRKARVEIWGKDHSSSR